MSKKKKRNDKLKLKYEPEKIDVKWEDLKELNLTIRTSLKDIIEEIKKLKAMQVSFKIEDENIDKIFKGILGTIKDIIKDVEEVSSLHGNKVDDNTIAFYKGPVNIDNNEFALYTDILTTYTALNEKISTLQYTSILAYITELTKALEKKGVINGKPTNNTESTNSTKPANKE